MTDTSTQVHGAVFEGFVARVRTSESVAHKPLGAKRSLLSSKGFSAAARTAAFNDSHREHVCGLVHKSPIAPVLCAHGLSRPPHQSSAHPRSTEPRGGHAFEEGDSSRRVEVAPRVGSDDLEPLRESGGGSACHEREGALPAVLFPVSLPTGRGRADIALASSKAVCVSSDQDNATSVMQDQGGASFSDTHHPEPAEPALVPRPDRTAGGTALADRNQEGFAIPGGRLGVAPEPGVVKPSYVAASGISEGLSALHSRVLDTLLEARAPSMRHLYVLKWGVFVKLCGQAHIDPATCTLSDVLSFLQYRLDSGSLPSTLKVYVAALPRFVPRREGNRSVGTRWW